MNRLLMACGAIAASTLSLLGAWYEDPKVSATVDVGYSNTGVHYMNLSEDGAYLMVNLHSANDAYPVQLYKTVDLKAASGSVAEKEWGEALATSVFGSGTYKWKGGAISSTLGLMIPGSGQTTTYAALQVPATSWTKDDNAFAISGLAEGGVDGMDFNASGTKLYANMYKSGNRNKICTYDTAALASAHSLSLSATKETAVQRIRNLSCYTIGGKDLVYFGEGDVVDGGAAPCVCVYDSAADAIVTLLTDYARIRSDVMNVKVSGTTTAAPTLYVQLDNGYMLIYTLASDGKSVVSTTPVKIITPDESQALCGMTAAPTQAKYRNFEVTDDGEYAFFMHESEKGPTAPGLCVVRKRIESYLQSDGTQAIVTDFRATPTTKIEVEYEYVAVEGNKYVLGARGDTDGTASTMGLNCCVGHQSSKAVMYAFHVNKNNRWFGSAVPSAGSRARVVIDAPNDVASKVIVNGHSYENAISSYAGGTVNVTSAYPIAVFANNKCGTLESYSKIKLFSLKMYSEGVLVRDYIPFLMDGVAGLKDRVTGQFMAPASGTLAYGGEIETGTRPTGYLQSTGSAYIDTGYCPSCKTTAEIDFEMTQYNNVSQPGLIGSNGDVWFLAYLNGSRYFAVNLLGTSSGSGVSTGIAGDNGVRRTFRLDGYGRHAGLWKAGEVQYFGMQTSALTDNPSTSSLLVFSRQGWSSQYAKMKLYGLKILEAGALVRDYVPCVKDGVNGLYDKVSGGFLAYASGTVGDEAMTLTTPTDAYLESDGTQAILTDYHANPKTKMVADYEYVESAGGIYIAGARTPDKTTAGLSCAFYHQDKNYLAWSFHENGGNRWYGSTKPVTGKRYKTSIDYPNDWAEYWIDGVSTYSQAMSGYTSGVTKNGVYPLAVFANNNAGTFERHSKIRLHSLRCYEDGALVREYLPYKSGDSVGLFDTVTKKSFLNSASGANAFGLGGQGTDGSGTALIVSPASGRVKSTKALTLQAFAPGATSYVWYENGIEMLGETKAELTLATRANAKQVSYTVKPIFVSNGVSEEGAMSEPAIVDYAIPGLAIIVK